MKTFFLCVMALFGAASSYLYDDSKECIVEDTNFNCICYNRENITISAPLDFDIRHIIVKGCGTVNVPFGALTNLRLETFQILDIERLTIYPFAFMGVQAINFLRISDVSEFNLEAHGFIGLFNVSELIISNITATILSTYSFGFLSNMQYFLIENSNFFHLEDFAFVVTNISIFKIINSKFHELQNTTFKVLNSGEAIFESCYFSVTSQLSFSLSYIDIIKFQSCEFGVMSTSAVVSSDVQTFIFKNCSIERLERGAFESLEILDKLVFTHNNIKINNACAIIPNIISNISTDLKIEDCCNNFQCCNCSNFWMLSLEYSETNNFLSEQRNCIDYISAKDTAFVPVNDFSINCITFELKSLQSKAKFLPKDASVYRSTGQILNSQMKILFTHILLFSFSPRYFTT